MNKAKKVLFFDYWPGVDYLHASGAGIGSSLFKLAALADAQSIGYEVHLLTNQRKYELLENALGVDFIYFEHDHLNFVKFSKVISLGLPEEQIPEEINSLPQFRAFSSDHRTEYKNSPHISFWRKFTAESLDYEIPPSKSTIELCLESDELIKACQLLQSDRKWIGIPCQSISKLKNYTRWDEIIELFIQNDPSINIVLLGDRKVNFTERDRVLDLRGKTDIQLLKAIISRLDLLVGIDGLATNLAMVLGKPTVNLFTMISPENVIDELTSDKIISMSAGNCPYQFCYSSLINYRSSGCRFLEENEKHRIPECLKFEPKAIAECVIGLLN